MEMDDRDFGLVLLESREKAGRGEFWLGRGRRGPSRGCRTRRRRSRKEGRRRKGERCKTGVLADDRGRGRMIATWCRRSERGGRRSSCVDSWRLRREALRGGETSLVSSSSSSMMASFSLQALACFAGEDGNESGTLNRSAPDVRRRRVSVFFFFPFVLYVERFDKVIDSQVQLKPTMGYGLMNTSPLTHS